MRWEPQAGHYLRQLVLTVAGDPSDAQDLADADLEADLLQREQTALIVRLDVFEDQPLLGAFCALVCLSRRRHVVADHEPGEVARGQRAEGQATRHHRSATENGHAIGHSADLFQLVADEDDGAAFGGDLAQGTHQVL